jgi:hypothetical protein
MDKTTVYTKTAKGITQVNQKSASLSKDLMKVLKLIDGKSNFGQMMEKAEMDTATLTKALTSLQTSGFARVFQTQKTDDPFGGDAPAGGGDDFDFTAPGKMPAATQRVMPGAANDISELVRQQEKQESARKAASQAQDAARAKAKVEAESRAKLEAEARAKAEAERQAMEQAQRAKEASERAKAELEAKMREEAARKAAAAAAQAASQQKQTVEQKAKEEEEQRKFAELRARAEKEAKALAEARARAEAEAAALAKVRAEAEAAAKKQAAEATNAEAQLKARLKEEIETRIRGEMEDLLRNEIEEKTRDSMRASILEEAKLAAKAELDERVQAERETLHKAEMEARSKAEAEANEKAAEERKLRAQAEARAVAATAAAAKAEEEARRIKAQAEADSRRMREEAEVNARRMREDAETRAKEAQEASTRLEVERRAKYEAEARAKIEAEEAEKRNRALQESLETERKATQEAEARARIEAKARETVAADTRAAVQAELETNLEKRAEIEGKAQAKAYMAAKAKAELDEDEKMRTDQARRAKEIADVLRTKADSAGESDAAEPRAKKRPARRRKGLLKTLMVTAALVLIGAVVLVHVIPMRSLAVKVEQALGRWLHDDVSIASAKFWLFPTPHLRVDSVAVGKLLDAKAAVGKIYLDVSTIFGDKLSINSLEFEGVSLSNEAVRRIPTWANTEGKGEYGSVNSISLKNVKLDVKPALDAFNADLIFDKKGDMRSARLTSPTWTLSMKPAEKGMDLDLDLRGYTLPAGIPIAINGATLKGTMIGNEIVVPEFDGSALDGKVSGTLKVTWGSGVRLESDLALARVDASLLVATFTKAIAVTGRVDGNFQVVAEGATPETLFQAPRVQGKFRITGNGSVSNVDLVAVMQSDAAGQRAGVTKFAELTGEYSGAEHRAAYRNLVLQGGVLRGNGSIEIGQGSALSGRASLEIRSQVAQDRGSFNITGTVSRPIIRRGG